MSEWYHEFYGSDPEAGNAFGKEALRLRNAPGLMARLSAGEKLSDILSARTAASMKAVGNVLGGLK